MARTARRVWTRLFGTEHFYVFVRYLKPPPQPVEFPVETNGVVVRHMLESDLADIRVKRHEPRDARLSGAVVATRQDQIVGAAWYMDSVTAEQPWSQAVERHLVAPARFTSNIFVVPGDKAAAWAIAKSATDQLATAGVRTIVGVVGVHNPRSILMSRLLGARVVARMAVRYWFGHRTNAVEPVTEDRDAAITTSDDLKPARKPDQR